METEPRLGGPDGRQEDALRAEKAAARAACEYVDYFFPPTEDGEGLDTKGGDLIRAVRALQEIQKREDSLRLAN